MYALQKILAVSGLQSRSIIRQFSKMPPRPIVLCGPSGVGKSTLLKKLMAEFDDCLGFSVSHTTRKPRIGEEDGVHYHFVSYEAMLQAINKGDFIEHAEYSGNLYGTSKMSVQKVADENKMCVLDIDIQGVMQVKNSDLNPHYIFIRPPSIEALENRLRGRGTETEESLAKRLTTALKEMDYGEEKGNFDEVIINENADDAYSHLKEYLRPDLEKLKCQ